MNPFEGPLADHLTAFVAFKRSMGYRYEIEAAILRRFDRWSGTQPNDPGGTLPQAWVEGWLARSPLEGDKTHRRRVGVLRHCALYRNTIGQAAYIPEPLAPSRHYTFVPHIFTAHELTRIFAAADHLLMHRQATRPGVWPVLLRLLYGCGLRVSEAIRLTLADIDWQDQPLTIRGSKFGKDRCLPMAPSVSTLLHGYIHRVHSESPPSAWVFSHRDGTPMTRDNGYRRFREMLWYAGIPHRGQGRGPRVHDLRHTFAVHTLKAAVDRNEDVQAVLPVLSAYLGHASLGATEQYVRLTADAFPALRQTVDAAAGWVIPEVAWE